METLVRDLRFAIRRLVKKPVFTTIAIASLAIGMCGTGQRIDVGAALEDRNDLC